MLRSLVGSEMCIRDRSSSMKTKKDKNNAYEKKRCQKNKSKYKKLPFKTITARFDLYEVRCDFIFNGVVKTVTAYESKSKAASLAYKRNQIKVSKLKTLKDLINMVTPYQVVF